MILLAENKTIKAQIFSTSLHDSELITADAVSSILKVGKAAFSLLFSPPRLGLVATCRGGAGNPNIRSSIQPELSCLAASDCWSGCQVMSTLVFKQGKSFACSDFSVPTGLNPQLLSQDFRLFLDFNFILTEKKLRINNENIGKYFFFQPCSEPTGIDSTVHLEHGQY